MSSPFWLETVRNSLVFSEAWSFCYPFPIAWDKGRKQLKWISSRQYTAPFFITTALTLVVIGCGLLCLLDEQFFKQGVPMVRIKLFICLLVCSVLLAGVVHTALLQIHGQCYVHNWNLEKNLESFLRKALDSPTFGIENNFRSHIISLIIRIMPWEPYFMVISVLILNILINFDPVVCLFEKYNLVASLGWKSWLLLYCCRNLVILAVASDCTRTFLVWVFFILQLMIMKNNFKLMEKYEGLLGPGEYARIEEEHSVETPSPIVIYTRRYLGHVATENMIKCELLCVSGFGFVAECALIFVAIKEFKVTGLLMKLFIAFNIVLVNGALAINVPACIAMHEESEKIVRQWKYHDHHRRSKCFRKRAAALRLMTLHGGVGDYNVAAAVPSFKAKYYYAILDYVITMLLSF